MIVRLLSTAFFAGIFCSSLLVTAEAKVYAVAADVTSDSAFAEFLGSNVHRDALGRIAGAEDRR